MTIPLPEGWTNFSGGAEDPDLCGEDQVCPEPPCDVTPPEITTSGGRSSLSCTFDEYELDLVLTGGVPPFIWVTTAGILTVTGVRTATLAIHEIQDIVGFFKPIMYYTSLICSGYDPCLVAENYLPENNVLVEIVVDVRFRPYDCIGVEILPPGYPTLGGDPALGPISTSTILFPHPIGEEIEDRHCTMSHDFAGQDVLTADQLTEDESWSVQMSRCCVGTGSASVLVEATLAGKNGVNGIIHDEAPPFSETINIPIQHVGVQTDDPCHNGSLGVSRTDGSNLLDVRTQSMIDSGCCVTPAGINVVVTVTDAAGTVTFLTIPVV